MAKTLIKDKVFLSTLFTLSLPIAFQNLINTTLNALDNIMIGSLGSEVIAAVGFANQIFLVLSTLLFGVCTGCCIFISQFYGKKDYDNLKRSIALNLVGTLSIAVIFTALALFAPAWLIGLFTHDGQVISYGSQYMRLIAISYIPMALSFTYSSAMRAVGKSQIPLYISILSLFINAFFNYVFIFGKFGIAPMGVRGAAIGTIIARGVELILNLTITYGKLPVIQVHFNHITSVTYVFLKRFVKITLPVILNEGVWSVGIAIYSAIFGRLSTDAVAAMNITKVLENMMMVFLMGMGSAAGIMIGQKIGANDEKTAIQYSHTFTLLIPIISLIFCAIMLLIRPVFLSFYNIDPEIKQLTYELIAISTLVIPFKGFNYVHIVGSMRSGGDTIVSLLVDGFGVWGISIPLMLITGIWLHLDVRIVYFCSLCEEFVKCIIVFFRIKSNKWIKNLVHDM